MPISSHRRAWSAASAAVLVLAALPPAHGAPADPFTAAVPQRDASAPEGLRAAGGDHAVSETSGAASYSWPVVVPPGRHGVEPALALSYSSQGALRGGIAAGFTLELPTIERDTSDPGQIRYRLRGLGSDQRLIPVAGDGGSASGQTYRPELDQSFARVEMSPSFPAALRRWTVRTPDGRTRVFENDPQATDHQTRWHLTREYDAFGNTAVYVWSKYTSGTGYSDFSLVRIDYTSNPAAGLGAHARVDLVYAPIETCPGSSVPVGARADHHFGLARLFGARRLTEVVTSVLDSQGDSTWRTARRHTLGYDTTALSCAQGTPPLRYLSRLGVTAYAPDGVATTAPPVTLDYGPKDRSWSPLALGAIGHGEHGTGKGATGGLMDLDADGLIDKVWVDLNPANQRCRLHYRRGRRGGGFELADIATELPTAAWLDTSGPDALEACTLGGQRFRRPYADADVDHCRERGGFVSYHFMDIDGDGLIDLLTNVWAAGLFGLDGWSNAEAIGGDFAPLYTFSGGDPGDPDTDPPDPICGQLPLDPERASGAHRWRVFRNRDGLIARASNPLDVLTIASPRPLPATGNALETPGSTRSSLQTLVDIDGDGWLDIIGLPVAANGEVVDQLGEATTLDVWRGMDAAAHETWTLPAFDHCCGEIETTGTNEHVVTTNRALLADVDGDGLPDLLVESADGTLQVAWNQGGAFASPVALGVTGPVERMQSDVPGGWGWGMPLSTGRRGSTRRLLDVDGDGLQDLLSLHSSATDVTATAIRIAARNLGDRFVETTTPASTWDAAKGLIEASSGTWYRASDFVDLTGDGDPDLVSWTPTGQATVSTDDRGGTPSRLLAAIDNGRGGVVRFTYAASTDPSAVDLTGAILPAPRWVVRTMTIEAGAGQPASVSRYRYAAPVQGLASPSDLGPPRFLGFARVETETPRQDGAWVGARVVRDFDFAIGDDATGRLVREQTFLEGATTASYDRRSTWHNRGVLDAVTFTYRAEEVVYTCPPGQQSDTVCARLRTTETWTPWRLPDSGRIALYLHTRTVQGPGAAAAMGDRATSRDYQVRAGQLPYAANDYRVFETERERQGVFAAWGGVGYMANGRTVTVYDAMGLAIRTETSLTASGAPAVIERTFDPQTGNVLTIRRPNQVAVGGPPTTLGYDSHRIFAARSANERGHKIFTTTDTATGTPVRREGPGSRAMTLPGCTPGPLQSCTVLVFAPETWRIDGFGRVIEHQVTAEPTTVGGGYALQLAERTTYFDAALPNLRRTERLRDAGGTVWVKTDDRFDGRGRLVTRTERRQVSGEPDAVTTHGYDALGQLASTRVPDPQVDTGATVEYRYRRDGLGRVTMFSRPDRSVVRVTYTGLDVTTAESSSESSSGEPGATTTARHSVYGQLVALDEHDNPTEGQIATTTYAYDAAGRLASMVDADGVATAMTHDWADRRTTITRGERTWRYGYDADGNLVTTQTPVPAGALASDYTTTTTHDVLGRPLLHMPATRGMAAPRRAQLGIGVIAYAYDTAVNGVGQLAAVNLPFGTVAYGYDVRGLPAREERSFAVSYLGQAHATQWVERRFNLLGQVTRLTWDGGTRWDTSYDPRALPSSVSWYRPLPVTLASYQRSVAGAPRRRTSTYDQRRTWSYDALGRVTSDRVDRPTVPGMSWSERTYGYDGLGELRAVSGQNAELAADALFDYDRRHRLVRAQGPSAYDGVFEYTAGGNVRRAAVSGAGDVDRDVEYEYGDHDPQAVDRLVTTGGGAIIADLGYDAAGNIERKDLAGDLFSFTWDGDDQLREVKTPSGALEAYYYDHDGHRVLAMTQGAGVRFWFAESETHVPADATPAKRWHHVALGEPIARIENNTSVELQYADALQNLMLSLSSNGIVRAAFTYGPFGEVLASVGDADHRRQFNGKEHDASTGWRYYGFRSYDPLLLRWTSADPLYRVAPDWRMDEPQRANLYAFTGNNPVRFIDPDGLQAKDEPEPEPEEPAGVVEAAGASAGMKQKVEIDVADGKPSSRSVGTITLVNVPVNSGAVKVEMEIGAGQATVNVEGSALQFKRDYGEVVAEAKAVTAKVGLSVRNGTFEAGAGMSAAEGKLTTCGVVLGAKLGVAARLQVGAKTTFSVGPLEAGVDFPGVGRCVVAMWRGASYTVTSMASAVKQSAVPAARTFISPEFHGITRPPRF